MKICVAGDSGLLGQAVVQFIAGQKGHRVLGFSTSPFQGTPFWKPLVSPYEHRCCRLPEETAEVSGWFREFPPDILINAIAWADIKDCEENPAAAQTMNAEVPEFLARAARENGMAFIKIPFVG